MSSKLDYLKKYLSSDKEKKSKKKKKHKESRIKIIDDSEVANNNVDDDLFEYAGEDAPQIVNMEEFKAAAEEKKFVKSNWQNLPENPKNPKNVKDNKLSNDYKDGKLELGSDLSPKRIKSTSRNVNYDSDLSPERASQKRRSPQRTADLTDSDLSPQRISRRRNSDLSPARKTASNMDNDDSPRVNRQRPEGRKNYHTRDLSPKRKYTRFNPISSPGRHNYNDDKSPPRRRRNSDNREDKRRSDHSLSRSPRERRNKNMKDSDAPKNSTKRFGFQDSSTLKKESKNLKAQQDEIMQNLHEQSNNDEPNVRDYGRNNKRLKHDPKKELELQKKLETYRKWGKGLKQIEEYKSKQIDEINTGSKPLARYSNDQDLEEMLKNTERSGDPMLEYLRKSKSSKNADQHSIPVYKGPMPQNRFNLRPGYRWDGVDRSNGYEKKLFDVKNQRIAIQEEAYKYSTEDM